MKHILCCTVFTTVILGAFSIPTDVYIPLTDKNPFPADVKLPKQSLFGAAVNLDLSKNGSIIPYPLSLNFSTNYETGVGGTGNVVIPMILPLSAFFGFPPVNFTFAFTANKNVSVALAAEAGSNNTVDAHEVHGNGAVTVGSGGWNVPSGWVAPTGWDAPSGWSEPTGWTPSVEQSAWTPPVEHNAWSPPVEHNAWSPPSSAWSAWTAPTSAWTAPTPTNAWVSSSSAWTAPTPTNAWSSSSSAWTAPTPSSSWTPPAQSSAWGQPPQTGAWTPPTHPGAWTPPTETSGWLPPTGWPQRNHGSASNNRPHGSSDRPRPNHGKPVAAPVNAETANPAVAAPEPVPATAPEQIPAATIEPVPAATIEPVPPATIEPVPAATIEPIPAATIEPIPAAVPAPVPASVPEPVPSEPLPTAESLVQDPLVEHAPVAVDQPSIPEQPANVPVEHDAANFESSPIATNEFDQSINPDPAVPASLAEDDHLKTKVSALLSSNSGKTRRHVGVEQPSALRIEDFEDVEVSQDLTHPPSPTSVETNMEELSQEEIILMAMEQAQQSMPMGFQYNMPRPPVGPASMNSIMSLAAPKPQHQSQNQRPQPVASEQDFENPPDLRNSETLNSAISKNVPSKISGEFSKGKPRPYGMDPAKNKPAKTRPTLDMGMKDKDQQFGIPHYASDFVQKEQMQSNPSSVLGWQLPSINWPSFTNLFQNFMGNRHKLAKSDAEDAGKACVDDESEETIVRSPTIQSGQLCQASSSTTMNRCNQACIDNGFASGNCLGPYPTPGCMCRMPNNKEYGLVLSPLDKAPKDENAQDMQVSDMSPCKKCGCTEACKSSGSYMGFCVDKCYCAVPWYTKQE